jgi:F0F1-type ATP synthase assembly protein I
VNPARGGSGADTGWAIIGTMLSGMAVWGGAGWLLDLWLDIKVLLPVGIILGMAVSIYMVVVKYGGAPEQSAGQRTSTTPGGRRSRPRGEARTQKGQR